MELNDVIKELEELRKRVSELEDRITKEDISDISDLSWANWVATDEDGCIFAFTVRPIRGKSRWGLEKDGWFESITPEQAILMCGRVPVWTNDEPTQIKR